MQDPDRKRYAHRAGSVGQGSINVSSLRQEGGGACLLMTSKYFQWSGQREGKKRKKK